MNHSDATSLVNRLSPTVRRELAILAILLVDAENRTRPIEAAAARLAIQSRLSAAKLSKGKE